jgi:hypothetical protein
VVDAQCAFDLQDDLHAARLHARRGLEPVEVGGHGAHFRHGFGLGDQHRIQAWAHYRRQIVGEQPGRGAVGAHKNGRSRVFAAGGIADHFRHQQARFSLG